ncbi:hypothetical protein B7463_g3842, partial [Scytalidium lignicola]
MRGEEEIMDEIHGLVGELKSFPADAHWFCPKLNDDDPADYDNPDIAEEDVSSQTKHQAIEAFKRRKEVAYKVSLVLGLSPEVSGRVMEDYTRRLNTLLTSCSKCVSNWHMGRKGYLKQLAEQFDDDTIAELSDRLDRIDFDRIDRGLATAEKLLSAVEPAQRTQKLLAQSNAETLVALYEALCCINYHKSDQRLAKHFDYVFQQVQNKKPLRIEDTIPAMTRFLFHPNPIRLRFATSAWEGKMRPMLTTETFDWVVHDNLSESMWMASQLSAPYPDIQRFWDGFLLMLNKMDQNLITHSLRAMEIQPDIYHVALQHLSCKSEEILRPVIKAISGLIRKSSKDFWSAMGTISPVTVAEQIFLNPTYKQLLAKAGKFGDPEECFEATSWIPDFIGSLAAVHQYDACRSLLYHLLERLQGEALPQDAQLACCRAALEALCVTLSTFVDKEYKINPSTSLIVINNVLSLVDKYKVIVLQCADAQEADQGSLDLKRLGMLVIRDALDLDCKALSSEYTALLGGTPIQRDQTSHSRPIWEAVLQSFRPGNLELGKNILAATSSLIGLDRIWPQDKKKSTLSKDSIQFNKDFQQLTENISKVYERLSDFEPDDLLQMYRDPLTARPMFAALMSGDQATYEAAIELVKVMTGMSSKQEAFSIVLDKVFVPTLNSLTFAITRISKTKAFTPVPFMIKTGREVLKALCGSTGALRTRTTSTTAEQHAITTWWAHQWRGLDFIFRYTEHWTAQVDRPLEEMEVFCRDAMEYAEALFDQYSIVAAALDESNASERVAKDSGASTSDTSKASQSKVLQVVCNNVFGLTLWLRLRDSYLVSVITSLLGKLLRSLAEFDMEIEEEALQYIKDALKQERERGFRKTNLTNLQKAELQRALDEHQGLEFIEPEQALKTAAPKKQSTIEAWSRSAEGIKHEPKTKLQTTSALSSHNNRILEAMRARQTAESRESREKADAIREKRKKEIEEKRQRDALAIARAKALRSNIVPGEGSGLKGIGIEGKEHGPIRSEIMVGSSDEESDDEDNDSTDALLLQRKATSQKVREYEESKRLALKQMQQGPVRKTKVQRSAKDLRARVEPNMDKLYIEILNWDIFHHGDDPPSNSDYKKIAYKFLDLDLYKRTFGPLLISEVWRSLMTAKDENNFAAVEITILNRLSVDKFMEVSSSMPIASNRDMKISERDIVLLSRGQDPLNNQQEPHCLGRVERVNRKKDVVEVTYRVSRDCPAAFLQCMVPNGKVHALKIADMTTTQREFAALSSLEYYDLCSEILEAKPSPIQRYSEEKVSAVASKYQLNRGQAQAILSANDNDGFTLIQGPPGSGKTKTIVAMVGTILTPILQQQALQARARPAVPGASAPSNHPKKKLLICAPSNAAVDELVVRLKQGIQPLNGPLQKISVIRIGRSDAINADVKDVMLDELVRVKLEGDKADKNGILSEREKLHQEAGKIKEQLNVLRPQMGEARGKQDKALELKLQREFDLLKRRQAHIGSKIDEDKESGNTVSRQNEINRRRFQQEIIDSAHVLCATLSGSGHDIALIPLKYGCSKCILVGDPEQLPPTVLSRSAKSFGYEQSLFVRMQHNHPQDVHLLDTQYRMHPEISRFPSKEFYGGRLIDGNNMARLREKPWHTSTILGPYRFFDVKGVQTKEARGHSFINIPELNAALQLYRRLKTDYSTYDFKGKIGIITSYKAQLNELKSRFARTYGDSIFEEIEFNTTDAFQGREREIIIFSCVRAKATGGIGFLGDIRRMNVGLTRAKCSLWVLGDSKSLQQGEFWNKLIEDSKVRNRYTNGDVMALLSKPTSKDRKITYEEPPYSTNDTKSVAESRSATPRSIDTSKSEPGILPKLEDSDVEMIDAPTSAPLSRISSVGPSSPMTESSDSKDKTRDLSAIKEEPSGLNPSKKHMRELSLDDPIPPKRLHTPSQQDLKVPKDEKEKEANIGPQISKLPPKPAPGSLGILPPRKKVPVDPFIKRKPARR